MFKFAGPVLAASVVLGACASVASPPPPPPAPDYSAMASQPAPARSILYTDCIGQAIERDTVALVADDDARLLQFTCGGAPAQRFNEALAVAGEAGGSVWTEGATTFRATTAVRTNLFGVDYCSKGPDGTQCRVVLNTGSFLTGGN